MRKISVAFVFAVVLSLLAAACGPANAIPGVSRAVNRTYSVGEEILPGIKVIELGPDGWYLFRKEFEYDNLYFKPATNQVGRIEGFLTKGTDRLLRGAKNVLQTAGFSRDLAYLGKVGTVDAVITPYLGESIDSLWLRGAITEEQYLDLLWKGRDFAMEAREVTGMVWDSDIGPDELLVYDNNTKALVIDVEDVYFPGEKSSLLSYSDDTYLARLNHWFVMDAEQMTGIKITEIPPYPYQSPFDNTVATVRPPRPKVSDYPTSMNEFVDGYTFRGNWVESIPETTQWKCIVLCNQSYATWVTIDPDKGILFAKVIPTLEVAQLHYEAWRIQLSNVKGQSIDAIEIRQFGNKYLVISPDKGFTWSEYWLRHDWDDNVARQLVDDMVDLMDRNRANGLAYSGDFGLKNFAISENLEVTFIDQDSAQLLRSNGTFDYTVANDPEMYRNTIKSLLDDQLEMSAPNFRRPDYDSMATKPPVLHQQADEILPPANEPLQRVRFYWYDGKIYTRDLTATEFNIVKMGGDDALRLLESKQLPIPASRWGKTWQTIGKVGITVGYVTTGYFVLDELWNQLGLGDEIELGGLWNPTSPVFAYEPTDPFVIDQATYLSDMGFSESPMFYNYHDYLTLDELLLLFQNRFNQSFSYRLDNKQQPELVTVIDDSDTVPPIIVSSDGVTHIRWTNIVTGEYIQVNKLENQWIYPLNRCMVVDTIVPNNMGNSVITPFNFCVLDAGRLFSPTWMNQ